MIRYSGTRCMAGVEPHEEAAEDTAVQIALLWLAHEGVAGSCVPHEHAVPRRKRWQICHGTRLCQQPLCPRMAGVRCICMASILQIYCYLTLNNHNEFGMNWHGRAI